MYVTSLKESFFFLGGYSITILAPAGKNYLFSLFGTKFPAQRDFKTVGFMAKVLRIILAAFLLAPFFNQILYSQNPSWIWSRYVTAVFPEATSVIDPQGNIIIASRCADSTVVAGQLLTGNAYNIFLVKYSPNGIVIWAKNIISSRGMVHSEIDCDAKGNIYIAGGWMNDISVTIGSTTFTSNIGAGGYIVSVNSSGSIVWAKTIANTQINYFTHIEVGNSGKITVLGRYLSGPLQVENHILPAPNGENSFFAEYDKNGNLNWVKGYSNSVQNLPLSLALDSDGNSLICISVSVQQQSTSSFFVFLHKFDTTGNLTWKKRIYGTYLSSIVACDGQNNIYHTSQDSIHKLDRSGNILWSTVLSQPVNSVGKEIKVQDLATDPSDNLYLTGYFYSSQLAISNLTLINSASNQTTNPIPTIFASKFDPNGKPIWLKGIDIKCTNYGLQIAVDQTYNVYVCGQTECAPILFDQDTLRSDHPLGISAYLAKLTNDNLIGITERKSDNFFVGPNPANNAIKIFSDTENILSVELYSLEGASVFSYFNISGSKEIFLEVSNIPKGFYCIKIEGKRGKKVKKVILE